MPIVNNEVEDDELLPSIDKTCRDCGEMFTLTAGERRFFSRKGLFEPKRCVSCRDAKRDSATAAGD